MFSISSRGVEELGSVQIEQLEHQFLSFGQLVGDVLLGLAREVYPMEPDVPEKFVELVGRGFLAGSALRVDRNRVELLLFHRRSDLALDQSVHEEREEVE